MVANSSPYKRFNTGGLEEQATFPEAVTGLKAVTDARPPSCCSAWSGSLPHVYPSPHLWRGWGPELLQPDWESAAAFVLLWLSYVEKPQELGVKAPCYSVLSRSNWHGVTHAAYVLQNTRLIRSLGTMHIVTAPQLTALGQDSECVLLSFLHKGQLLLLLFYWWELRETYSLEQELDMRCQRLCGHVLYITFLEPHCDLGYS